MDEYTYLNATKNPYGGTKEYEPKEEQFTSDYRENGPGSKKDLNQVKPIETRIATGDVSPQEHEKKKEREREEKEKEEKEEKVRRMKDAKKYEAVGFVQTIIEQLCPGYRPNNKLVCKEPSFDLILSTWKEAGEKLQNVYQQYNNELIQYKENTIKYF